MFDWRRYWQFLSIMTFLGLALAAAGLAACGGSGGRALAPGGPFRDPA